jgi:hypothetical protein
VILVLAAIACTRANPAYQPQGLREDGGQDAAPQPVPDAALSFASLADAPPDLVGPEAPPAPTGLALIDPSGSPPIAPPDPGGRPFGESCGPGRVLTGLIGTSGALTAMGLDSVQARCAELTFTTAPAIMIGTGNSVALAAHGTVGGARREGICPANQVITGLEGAVGPWIDRLYVHCAALTVRIVAGGLDVVIEAPTRLEIPLGSPTPNALMPAHCPPGAVAVGIEGNSGLAVDLLALRCARPTLR